MDLKELYQDIILEHGKSPRNFGECEKYTHQAKGHNPLCGDQVEVFLKLNNNKEVENLTFKGSGCAISIASTSIMTELVKGKSLEIAKKIIEEFLQMITNTTDSKLEYFDEDQKIKVMSLSGVKQYPMRVKCATLAWHTLNSAIEGKKEEINTEIPD
jgi:nitrogen fixation protein NifU and related proteins